MLEFLVAGTRRPFGLSQDCVVIMGTAGDIDEDLLLESGDGSPEKVMAALQTKLDVANERITQLTEEARLRRHVARHVAAARSGELRGDDQWISGS
eukprot:Skav208771  [mRNA]  locus=scaffold2301:137932:139074:+ [translate_table: standard]